MSTKAGQAQILTGVVKIVGVDANDDVVRIRANQPEIDHGFQFRGPVQAGAQRGLGQQNRAAWMAILNVVVYSLKECHVFVDVERRSSARKDGRDLVPDLKVADLRKGTEDIVDLLLDVRCEQILIADESKELDAGATDTPDDRIARVQRSADLDSRSPQLTGSLQGGHRVAIGLERLPGDMDADVRRPLRADFLSQRRIRPKPFARRNGR